MWNLKYNTNESIYKTERDSQTQKTNFWLPKGKGKWGGKIKNMGLTKQIQTTVHKIDKQQGLTVQQRELYLISCNNLLQKIT